MANKSSTSRESKKAGQSLKEKRAAKNSKKAAQTDAHKAWER